MNTDQHHIAHSTSSAGIIAEVWKILNTVNDPEVPVLSITDLGIVRDVKPEFSSIQERNSLESSSKVSPTGGGWGEAVLVSITITPTYSGCPAMNQIEWDIKTSLLVHGFKNIKITTVLSPAWTTDWMTEEGKQKLKAYGIAPPNHKQQVCNTAIFIKEEAVQCPQCNSWHTARLSEFGSTACKALYQCKDCHEPFDYFKCH